MKHRVLSKIAFVCSPLLLVVSVTGAYVAHSNTQGFEKEVWGGCGPCSSLLSGPCGQEESESCSEDPNAPCEGFSILDSVAHIIISSVISSLSVIIRKV